MSEKQSVLVALGTFDGLHIGHKAVLFSDKKAYDKRIVLLFNEHPQKLLTGKNPGELLTRAKKESILKEWGYEPQYIDFGEISEEAPEEFIDEILVKRFGATALCCGFNYRFGKKASGDVALLKRLCAEREMSLTVCNEIDYESLPVSSTRIRNAIACGDIESANKMLGYHFSYDFQVVHGDARGRILGSPTINQFFPADFTVAEFGVYASYTIVDGQKYVSVTNIGVRPTVEGVSEKRSETNIIGFNGDLYGQRIEVSLLKKIRNEMKFNSFDELSNQIAIDRNKAIEIVEKELHI